MKTTIIDRRFIVSAINLAISGQSHLDAEEVIASIPTAERLSKDEWHRAILEATCPDLSSDLVVETAHRLSLEATIAEAVADLGRSLKATYRRSVEDAQSAFRGKGGEPLEGEALAESLAHAVAHAYNKAIDYIGEPLHILDHEAYEKAQAEGVAIFAEAVQEAVFEEAISR